MKLLGFLASAILFLPVSVYGGEKPKSKYDVEVMVQNQYLGTSLAPIIQALTAPNEPPGLVGAVEGAILEIQLNNTPARLKSLAESIADKTPHLVALQEVVELSCNDQLAAQALSPFACSSDMFKGVFNDHLALTLGALEKLGAKYKPVAVQENISISFSLDLSGDSNPDVVLSVKDRDVILVRSDIQATIAKDFPGCNNPTPSVLPYDEVAPRKDGCTYSANIKFPHPIEGPYSVNRGFVGVDAKIGGIDFRFVNTHLETLGSPVQSYQAAQLIDVLSQTVDRHLLVAGDFNSDPQDPQYANPFAANQTPYEALSAKLSDIWLLRPGKPKGLTCCQDSDLWNEESNHGRRVDMIFAYPAPSRVKANVVNDKLDTENILDPIWSSDHAGVRARMQYD